MSAGADHGMAAEPLSHAPPPPRLPLRCRLGRHRPAREVRWNDGYYFSRCRDCGQDIVRTAYEGWHVPRGYRVVWQERPPADFRSAALVEAPKPEEPDAADDNQMELPISEVIRTLDEPERPHEPVHETEESAPLPSPSAAIAPRGRVWDFMDEEGDGAPGAATASPPAASARDEAPDMLELTVTASARAHPGAEWTKVAAGSSAAVASRRARLAGLAALLAVGVGLLLIGATVLAALSDRPAPAPVAVPVPVVAQAQPTPPPAPAAAAEPESYVAASLLNCRAAPALNAAVVRTLTRGDAVRPLGRDDGWASVAVDDRQCWAVARYLSDVRPL